MRSIFFFLATLVIIVSCNSDDDPSSTNINNIKLNSTSWKVDHYEYKSKNYVAEGCDLNDKLVFNADMTGTYQNSEKSSSNDCYFVSDFAGAWSLDVLSNTLKLNYTANGSNQTKTLILDAISNDQIRVITTKMISNIGTVEVVEVWVKR